MANIYDNDILITQTTGDIYIDLTCGYGQPCVSTIYIKQTDGSSRVLDKIDNSINQHVIGNVSLLKYGSVEVHTTIDDIRDSENERLDISLNIKIYDSQTNFVDTGFTKKTKGKGSKFHSFYIVSIY